MTGKCVASDNIGMVQEIVKASIEDERGFSGVNPWSTKLVCGKCGNYLAVFRYAVG
jgi:hypothetical protein